MKKLDSAYMFLVILLLFTINLTAQIDTTDWYPMHIGDKWEYYSTVSGYSQVEIIGDTLMPNGTTYSILTLKNRKYQRVKDNRYVMVYNEYAVVDSEYIHFDLLANKGDVFVLSVQNTGGYYGYGVYEISIDNNNLLQQNLKWKEYRDVYIDTTISPPDTLWNEIVDTYWPRITKGLGVTSYAYGLDVLVGIKINDIGYGTLVSVDENIDIVNEFKLYQNYPNPFNPNTTIKYIIPTSIKGETTSVKLVVYDVLGRAVATLVNKKQKAGNYEIQFSAYESGVSGLSSGIYFYQLTVGDFRESKTMLLIK